MSDTGFSTPLLDLFRRGEVARDLRLLAAQGGVATRVPEQLGLLVLLAADADPDVASTADATLARLPADALAAFLGRADVPAEMRAFFTARGVAPGTPSDERERALAGDASDEGEPAGAEDERSVVQRLAAMSVAERVVRAMKGSREERAILVRDPNKLVNAAVLSSPKLSETEVEAIARMGNVSEDVLRIISRTRAWMKSYAITAALARNAKTPVAVSMNLLPRLTEKDLKLISTDRNVPDVVRVAARRKVVSDK